MKIYKKLMKSQDYYLCALPSASSRLQNIVEYFPQKNRLLFKGQKMYLVRISALEGKIGFFLSVFIYFLLA